MQPVFKEVPQRACSNTGRGTRVPHKDMSLETMIATYGYGAVLVGTFLEGETVVLLGGFAAHRGYLDLPWVIAVAFAGSLLGDQLYFYLGRRHSARILRSDRDPVEIEGGLRMDTLMVNRGRSLDLAKNILNLIYG